MKAMILAAGRGERMRPLTDHTPKPLLEVGGKPLIAWHLERLAQCGFRDIVINHAHLGAQIEAALGNGERWGLSIQYSAEAAALETAGGIAYALHLLGDQPFLIVNGDVYSNIDFSVLVGSWQRACEYSAGFTSGSTAGSTLAHLVMVNNPPQHADGDFSIVDGRLTTGGGHKLTYSGIGIYDPALFTTILPGQVAKLAPLLTAAIAEGLVSAEHFQGAWHDIGTPERLQALDWQLRKPVSAIDAERK